MEKILLEELNELELLKEYGSAWWNISYNLGNNGKFCTLTKECMPTCN